MNSVSWFIYLADVLPRVGTVAFICATIMTICLIIITVSYYIAVCVSGDERTEKEVTPIRIALGKSLRFWWLASFIMIIGVFMPAQKTLYMIAASEVSGVVINDPRTQEVFDTMSNTIKQKLEELTEKEKS